MEPLSTDELVLLSYLWSGWSIDGIAEAIGGQRDSIVTVAATALRKAARSDPRELAASLEEEKAHGTTERRSPGRWATRDLDVGCPT
jgi:hypothetical protein